MPALLSPAYVLHSRPYRDSSALVDLLTLEYGLQRVVWRGARNQRRKLTPQLFVPLLVGVIGRSDLKTLTQAEVAGSFVLLQGEALFSGLYLNELLVRLLGKGESQPVLFAAYQHALEQLARSVPVEPTLRRFEWQLLDCLGYGFSLQYDANGQPITTHQRYIWHATDGLQPVIAPASTTTDLPGAALLAMAADDWSATMTLRAAKQLMRQALGVQLGDRPLVSRTLFTRQPYSTKGEQP